MSPALLLLAEALSVDPSVSETTREAAAAFLLEQRESDDRYLDMLEQDAQA